MVIEKIFGASSAIEEQKSFLQWSICFLNMLKLNKTKLWYLTTSYIASNLLL
jgi:hypothetical protein